MSDSPSLRRAPKQTRSQQRVDHILDTAAQVFEEVGYETATTNTIAARAGVPIGSLYQFFPNKEAILHALVTRYVTALRLKIAETMTPEASAGLPITIAIERMILTIAAFEISHAGFRAIFMNTQAEAAHAIHHEIVAAVSATISARFPDLPPAERQTGTLTMVRIVKGLMGLSEAPDHLPLDTIAHEMIGTLLAYLRLLLRRNNLPLPEELQQL